MERASDEASSPKRILCTRSIHCFLSRVTRMCAEAVKLQVRIF